MKTKTLGIIVIAFLVIGIAWLAGSYFSYNNKEVALRTESEARGW